MAATRRRGDYRKVWEKYHNTKIPDKYHIHHLDGDGFNDDPENLICVSPTTHFWIHYFQGDVVCARNGNVDGGLKWFNSSMLGHKCSDKTKEKISIANRGNTHTDESKEKMRIANLGKKNPFFGKKHTEAAREKMRQAINPNIGKKHTEAAREKMRLAAKKRPPMSDEHKENIRQAALSRWAHARQAADRASRKLKNDK